MKVEEKNASNWKAWKTTVELNELIKKDFHIEKDSVLFKKQKNIFNKPIDESSYEYENFEKIINPDNLIYREKVRNVLEIIEVW